MVIWIGVLIHVRILLKVSVMRDGYSRRLGEWKGLCGVSRALSGPSKSRNSRTRVCDAVPTLGGRGSPGHQ
jgi:hypothetical protein